VIRATIPGALAHLALAHLALAHIVTLRFVNVGWIGTRLKNCDFSCVNKSTAWDLALQPKPH